MRCASATKLAVDQKTGMYVALVCNLALIQFALMDFGIGNLAGSYGGGSDKGARNGGSLDVATFQFGASGRCCGVEGRVDDGAGGHFDNVLGQGQWIRVSRARNRTTAHGYLIPHMSSIRSSTSVLGML